MAKPQLTSIVLPQSLRQSALLPPSATAHLPKPVFHNGMGVYVPQLRRLVLKYCDRGGSSRDLTEFIRHEINELARMIPYAEIQIAMSPGRHPLARGVYISGRVKTLTLRGVKRSELMNRLKLIIEQSDAMTKPRPAAYVENILPPVRGIWSPYEPRRVTYPKSA